MIVIYIFIYFKIFFLKIFKNFILFFFIINCFLITLKYSIDYLNQKNSFSDNSGNTDDNKFFEEYKNQTISKDYTNFPNIYYIILDGMMSLEKADFLNISKAKFNIDKLNQEGLRYIENSFGSYNSTHNTLASLFNMDYFQTEKNYNQIKIGQYFPAMMYRNSNFIPLIDIISKIDINFEWLGNFNANCIELKDRPWKCLGSPFLRNLHHVNYIFFSTTPLDVLLNKFLAIDKSKLTYFNELTFNKLKYQTGQKNLSLYIELLENDLITNNNKFTFIHHNSPHFPYMVDENCNPKKFNDNFEGYKASYLCVLKKVIEFTNYINISDPDSIIVFQADHGWGNEENMIDYTSEEKMMFRASIFNAIKAPQKCFDNFSEPKHNVNTIRFVLNCAYNFNFTYEPNIYYAEYKQKYLKKFVF